MAPGLDVAPAEAGAFVPNLLRYGVDFEDAQGLVSDRYDAGDGAVYLIRPDQHIATRWRKFDADAVNSAISRATAGAI